jgi:hypothetical protein
LPETEVFLAVSRQAGASAVTVVYLNSSMISHSAVSYHEMPYFFIMLKTGLVLKVND